MLYWYIESLISAILAQDTPAVPAGRQIQEETAGESQGAAQAEAEQASETDTPEKKMTYITCITPQQSGYISMENIVKMYQEQVNPNFSMDIQYIADKPAYLQKIKTLVASNETPDMFNLDTDPCAIKLLDQGIVVDLNETMDKYGLKDVFLPAPLCWGTAKDGRQIAMLIDFSIEVFWYNKRMFEEAGVTIPTTHSEFLETCEKLKMVNRYSGSLTKMPEVGSFGGGIRMDTKDLRTFG